jgi:catechol-2,3-dioxygenase
LTENYLRLKALGIRPHRCVNHGVTTSMYYRDPDGNQVELLVDNFATAAEGQAYMRRRSAKDKNPVGVACDPEELVARVGAGLQVGDLVGIND